MFHQTFITAFEFLVLFAVFALAMTWFRRVIIRNTFSLQHQIDNEETVAMGVDILLWDSPADVDRKLHQLYDIAEKRHRERFEKWQALLAEQQAEGQKAKGKLSPAG